MGVDNEFPKDLSDSIGDLLGPNTNITLKKFVKAEYKNTVDRKILVLTDHRVVLFANKVPTKIEVSIHFLQLQNIESKDQKLVLKHEGRKLDVFATKDPAEIDQVVFQISDSLMQIFPHMTLEKLTGPLNIAPPSRMKYVTDKLKSKTLLRDISPCGNFSSQYRCMCNLHNLPYQDEVTWDVDTIYLSQNCKSLILGDFDHLEAKHLLPIIAALKHNTWFTTLCSCNVKLSPDAMNEFAAVLKTNTTVQHVCSLNSGGRSDFVQKVSSALTTNISETAVDYLDFKGNPIEDKGAQYLCPVISTLPKGLVHLDLSKCRLTQLSVNRLAGALCSNPIHMTTLNHLNLSGNSFKDDITNFHNFLAQPNALTQLNLSGTECALDNLFGALYRGCSLKLEHLILSNNIFTNKKVRGTDIMVPVSWKQYFSSAVALRSVSVADTKLPLDAVKNLLLGINSNEHLNDVEVNLRNTGLGEDGAQLLETCLGENKNITHLDVSDNGFEQHTSKVVQALGTNNHLKKLSIGKNINNLKPKHIPAVVDAIVDLISAEDSTIESLSVADSKLKGDTVILINALGGNSSLTELDISGNGMGDYGAKMLSKALHINNKLQVLHWDNNNISPQGYTDIAWAMTKNFCLCKIPTPLNDITTAQRMNQKKTHKAWHGIEECLLRNNSPRRFGSEQAYRLQQGFLLSTTQQAIDKYIVQVLDCINDLEKGDTSIAIINEIGMARGLMKDAENCRHLLIQLQKVGLKCEESGNVVEKKLKVMADELQDCLESQLKSTLSSMLTCVEGQDLSVMQEKQFEVKVREGSEEKVTVPKNFCSTVLLEQVATEMYNKTSEVNVSVASYISEELIEGLLVALERCSKTLLSYQTQESELDKAARRSILRVKSKVEETEAQAPTNYRQSVKAGKLRPVSTVCPSDSTSLQSSSSGLDHFVLHEANETDDDTSAEPSRRPVTSVEAHASKTDTDSSSKDRIRPQALLQVQSASLPSSLSITNTKPSQPISPKPQSKSPLPSPRGDKPPPPVKPAQKPAPPVQSSTGAIVRRSLVTPTTKYVSKGDHFTPSPERVGLEEGDGGDKPKPAPRRKHVKLEGGSQRSSELLRDSTASIMSVSIERESLSSKNDNKKPAEKKINDADVVKEVEDTDKMVGSNKGKDTNLVKDVKDIDLANTVKVKEETKLDESIVAEIVDSTEKTDLRSTTIKGLNISEDESSEEDSERASPEDFTVATGTNSADSLLEEGSKPEKKEDKKEEKKPIKKSTSAKNKSANNSTNKSKEKKEDKVKDFEFLAPSTEAPKLNHLNKDRPKRHNVKRPTNRKDVEEADDVSEGLSDFYKKEVVSKQHVVPTVATTTTSSSKPREDQVNKANHTGEKTKPEKKVLKPPKGKLQGLGKFNPFKSSKSQENVTSPPKDTSTSTPSGTTSASPSTSSNTSTPQDSPVHNKTPESPAKIPSQRSPAPRAPVEKEKTPEPDEDDSEDEKEARDEVKEVEQKPKEDGPKKPPGALSMGMLGGKALLAEMMTKRNTMVPREAPSKPPPPSKSETSGSEVSSKPEPKERLKKPSTDTLPKLTPVKEGSPSQSKPTAPSRPPSLYPRLPSETQPLEKVAARSLSSSNAEVSEKKKEDTSTPNTTADSKATPSERNPPQPPARPNKPTRPPNITPSRSQTVPVAKAQAPSIPSSTAGSATRGSAGFDDVGSTGHDSGSDTTGSSMATVHRRSSIKDRIALLDKNSNEKPSNTSCVAEQPGSTRLPPPPPPPHSKPKGFAYLSRDTKDTTSGVESGTDGRPKSGVLDGKSKSVHGSTSSSSPSNSTTASDVSGNNNNNTTATLSKNSRPVVPARPSSKIADSPKVADSPPSSGESSKRASSASIGSTQEQEVKDNNKEVEVFL